MSKPPLWEVMTRARYKSAGLGEHVTLAVAAEIRAVAKWIEQRQVEKLRGPPLPDVREVIGWLAAEAARAERGEL